jgi:TonB family protein
VLTQHEPEIKKNDDRGVAIPDAIPQPFHGIAERCLRFDPRQRCTIGDILGKPKAQEQLPTRTVEPTPAKRSSIWLILPVVAAVILLAVLFGRRSHQPPIPSADSHPTESSTASSNAPATQSPAPFHDQVAPRQTGVARGKVLQEISPEVSQTARNTITGHVKVSVQVSVDTSGNVSQAKLVPPVNSKYFANQALAAARQWKFSPAQVNGQPSPSEWVLRFQFGRTSTHVSSSETKP